MLDARVVHGSPPNRSTARRLAVTGVVVPNAATLVHVRACGEDAIQLLVADDAFYHRWQPGVAALDGAPGLPVLADIPTKDALHVDEVLRGARRRARAADARRQLARAGRRWPRLAPVIEPML